MSTPMPVSVSAPVPVPVPATRSRLSGVAPVAEEVPIPVLDYSYIQETESKYTRELENLFPAKRETVMRERSDNYILLEGIANARQEIIRKSKFLRERIIILTEEQNNIQHELERSQDAIANYNSRLTELKIKKSHLDADIGQMMAKISKRKDVLAVAKHKIIQQASLNAPDVAFWEKTLGLEIDAVPGKLNFIFWNIDQYDLEKRFEISLDLTAEDPIVSATEPPLDEQVVNEILANFIKMQQLTVFLSDIRAEFIKLALKRRKTIL